MFKKTKLLYLLSFGIFPLALTSCANATYYFNPYYANANWIHTGDLQDLGRNGLAETDVISSYMPNSYVCNPNSGTYGYCQPDKIISSESGDTASSINDYNWQLPYLQSTDSNNGKVVISNKNQNLIAAIAITGTVASQFRNYATYIFNFLSEPAISLNNNEAERNTWLNALFTGNANADSSQPAIDNASSFYNFIFANKNLLSESGKLINFGVNGVNFDMPVITGTDSYAGQNINDPFLYVASSYASTLLNDPMVSSFSSDFKIGGTTAGLTFSSSYGEVSPNVTYVYNSSTSSITSCVQNYPIPMLFNISSASYSFNNYKSNLGNNPTDWLVDTDTVNSAISKTKSWKKYKNFVGSDPTVTNNQVSINFDHSSLGISSSFIESTYNDPTSSISSACQVDPFLKHIINDASSSINGNTFIGFVDYSFRVDSSTSTIYPICNGLDGFFPASLLLDQQNDNKFDTSLLKFQSIGSYPEEQQNWCWLDMSKVSNKFQSNFIGLFNELIPENSLPSNLTQDQQNGLKLFSNLISSASVFSW